MKPQAVIYITDSRNMVEIANGSVHLVIGETVLDPFLGSGTTVKFKAMNYERFGFCS